MKKTEWIVMTGPPSSGKTTLINALESMGYIIAPEVAREIIQYSLSHLAIDQLCARDSEHLQREILAVTLRREHFLDVMQPIFFDRGVPDSMAYFRYHGFDESDVLRASSFRQYKMVFYCQGLPVVSDKVRQESEKVAQDIGRLILAAYQELGYKVIILPAVSVEERLQMILKQVRHD